MNEVASSLSVPIDTLWVLVCAFLVFFMNAGFGCVESGFCRSKNAVNILAKNFVVFGIASLGYWAIGFGLMFGEGNAFFGQSGWLVTGVDNSPATGDAYQGIFSSLSWTGIPLFAKFFFQLAFAATAATIVSGCVAERIHYASFIVFAAVIAAIFYPITGHWVWGGGWLAELGMWDFAGSTVVHSVGGWAGLAGIMLLGPRIGKYRKNGTVAAIPGHSMPLAFLGGMILWLGWFGFNPGSTMGISGDGGLAVSHIVVTTNIACAAGLVMATLVAFFINKKPDFSMTVNGALAGLVAITAPCAFVTPLAALVIGAVGGVLVVYSVLFFDKIRLDDPVGALSVHLVNGIWGTLAVGIFATQAAPGGISADGLLYGGGLGLLGNQAIGVVAVGAFTFAVSYALWAGLKATIGIRVSPQVETEGLDIHEMGTEAYPAEKSIDVVGIIKESNMGRFAPEIVKVAERASKTNGAGTKPPYAVEVSDIDPGQFVKTWTSMCGMQGESSEEFRSIYKHFTRIKDRKLRFRGGDPEEVRQTLEGIAQGINPAARAQLVGSTAEVPMSCAVNS